MDHSFPAILDMLAMFYDGVRPDSEPWPGYVWRHLLLIGIAALVVWLLTNTF